MGGAAPAWLVGRLRPGLELVVAELLAGWLSEVWSVLDDLTADCAAMGAEEEPGTFDVNLGRLRFIREGCAAFWGARADGLGIMLVSERPAALGWAELGAWFRVAPAAGLEGMLVSACPAPLGCAEPGAWRCWPYPEPLTLRMLLLLLLLVLLLRGNVAWPQNPSRCSRRGLARALRSHA